MGARLAGGGKPPSKGLFHAEPNKYTGYQSRYNIRRHTKLEATPTLKQLATVLSICLALTAGAQQNNVVQTTLKPWLDKAKQQNQNVMVIFWASWCTWCKQHEAFVLDPSLKETMVENFTIAFVRVQESAEHKDKETKGGAELLKALGGEKQGIPFVAFVTPDGRLIANSNRAVDGKQENIGHPVKPEEIQHYMTIIRRAGPKLTGEQLAAIEDRLRNPRRRSGDDKPDPKP